MAAAMKQIIFLLLLLACLTAVTKAQQDIEESESSDEVLLPISEEYLCTMSDGSQLYFSKAAAQLCEEKAQDAQDDEETAEL